MVTGELRKQAKRIVGQIGRAVLDNEPARHIVNLAYERGPPGVQNLFVRLISQAPASALEWTIELASGARVVVPVRPGDLRGWQFALSYKWHDRGLRRTEAALLELVPRSGRLFDVGANMGLRSIYALAQGRPVTMFEPNPALRAFTEALLLRNCFGHCAIENVCVGGHEGTAKFYISRTSYQSSLDRAHASRDGEVKEIEAPLTTLDHYIAADPSARSCAVLKIDVEGAELEVLSGAAQVLEHSSVHFDRGTRRDQRRDERALEQRGLSRISHRRTRVRNPVALARTRPGQPAGKHELEQFSLSSRRARRVGG